jgi:glycosyltransferase involved in cell wall biosynthesis
MRIGIDARLVRYRRGMGNQIFNLLQGLATLSSPHDFLLYLDRPPAPGELPDALADAARIIGPAAYPVWEQLALPHHARRDRVEVLHCPNNTAPLTGLRAARLVLTVHDVMFLLPRAEVPPPTVLNQQLGRLYRRLIVPRAARIADRIVTVSEHSRRDIGRLLGLPESRIDVVPTGPGPEFHRLTDLSGAYATLQRHRIHRPYVLAFAASDPRKNVGALICGFAKLKENAPEYQLVLPGSRPKDSRNWQAQANRLHLTSDVVLPGFVSQAELVDLYNLAEFFVFPSLYEGFGLPVVEAMACGAPVIASRRSSIPEVAGGAALLVDPSADELGAAMIHLARDEEARSALVRAGLTRVKAYSWTSTAAQMLKIYQGEA